MRLSNDVRLAKNLSLKFVFELIERKFLAKQIAGGLYPLILFFSERTSYGNTSA